MQYSRQPAPRPAPSRSDLLPACLRGTFLLVTLFALAHPILAGDWPQILGPHRNAVSDQELLADSWPASIEPLWTYPVSSGYAGPAVVGQRVVIFHRDGEGERVDALDANTGKRLWTRVFPATYRGGVDSDTGPRCVPLIATEKVFLHGAAGDVYCVQLNDGRLLWQRSTLEDFGGNEGYFGAGSSPIIAAGKLLVNVGGRNGAGIVALDVDTGATAWKATDEQASYSSPTLATLDGKTYVVFVTRFHALAIDPAGGEVRFRVPFGQRGPTVNAATPLVIEDQLFVSASYGIGCRLLQINRTPPQDVWSSQQVMSSQYVTSVFYRGFLYGIHGREDVGQAALQCVDARNGKVMWSKDGFGTAHLTLVDNKLLILTVDGSLVQAHATPDAFEPVSRSRVSRLTTRSLPALSNGRIFLRENNSRDARLMCLPIGRSKAPSQP